MHWFHGITMDTEIGNIGWTYVVLGILIVGLIYGLIKLIKEWNNYNG